jgi:hypothetical protein
VSLLTPVIKGFLTDVGYDMTVKAQQIYGGHGYIEEWGMSQFTRDARIAMIYEGANGVQALESDLKLSECFHVLARWRVTRRMWAINSQASALAIDFSQSLARRRQRPSHAKVRSTTHLRGKTSKPSAVSERLII